MKRAFILAAILISACFAAFAQGPQADEKTRNEVMGVAKEFANALVNRDVKTAERVLDPDFADFSRGLPTTQFLLLRMFKEWNPAIAQPTDISFDENLTIVRIYDNTAVVTTKVNFKWLGKSGRDSRLGYMWPVADSNIITLVAVKRSGAWRIVTTHASPWEVVVQEAK